MDLVIDTETTGITRLSFANRLNYKQWPRLVQFAWVLGEDGAVIEKGMLLAKPEDFQIPAKAIQVHGISQTRALKEGVAIFDVLDQIQNAFQRASTLIAHNINFDLGVIESEAIRAGWSLKIPSTRLCTVLLGRKYLHKEKGIKRGGYPKLGNLYETMFGFPFGPKHDALSDALACYQVFVKLRRLGFVH
jgi:DNA polymerase III epsilon subunit-like protein